MKLLYQIPNNLRHETLDVYFVPHFPTKMCHYLGTSNLSQSERVRLTSHQFLQR